jgi:hypothetical protein
MRIWTGMMAGVLGLASGLLAADPPADPLSLLDQRAAETRAATAPEFFLSPSTRASRANALETAIQKGLTYLEGSQHDNGSFDRLQSVRIPNVDPVMLAHQQAGVDLDPVMMSDGPDKDAAEPDTEEIADTALAAETMMLAVNSGRRTELSPRCLKAIDFLCKQIKTWEGDTIYIQKRMFDPLHDLYPMEDRYHALAKDVRFYNSTVDTFFALRFLSEARDRIDDPARKTRVQAALDILLSKIIKCQDTNGTWPDETDPARSLPTHRSTNRFNRFLPVPPYDNHTANLISHCAAVSAINVASRNGVPIPAEVHYRADNYLLHALTLEKLGGSTKEACLRVIAVVAAETQAYETCRALLQQATSDREHGKDVTIDELNVLRTHLTQAKTDLKASVPYILDIGSIPTEGPALDALPEAIHGMEIVSNGGDDATFLISSYRVFLRRQLADGSIAATPPELLTRDDCTYGTATTLRLLMMVADAKKSPQAATQQ